MKHTPTAEQQVVIDTALTGVDVIVQAFSGASKAQPLWSKVQTPHGEKNIGDMRVGDDIFKSDGSIGKVIGVFPQGKKPYYKVTFRDGSFTHCNEEHLWQVYCLGSKKKGSTKTVTLKEIIDLGIGYSTYTAYRWKIPLLSAPLKYEEREHLIHPYILGVLLGDGYICGNTVSFSVGSNDEGIEKIVENLLPSGFYLSGRNTSENCKQYNICSSIKGNNPIKRELMRLGLCVKSGKKFIPDDYKMDCPNNRLWLIRGLMDTDGSCSKNRTIFGTTSRALADDIKILAQSLGWTAIETSTILKKGDRKSDLYYVNIKATTNPFFHRKSLLWSFSWKNPPSRYIHNVELVGICEQVCIKVDAEDSLYLTDACIVTHNTTTLTMVAEALKDKKILYVAFNKAIATEAEEKMPSNVTCKTVHSVAYGKTDKAILNKLRGYKTPNKTLVDMLSIQPFTTFDEVLQSEVVISDMKIVSWVSKTVLRYMQSSSETISKYHVFIDSDYSHLELQELKNIIYFAALELWDLYTSPKNKLNIPHDTYLKLFGLSGIDLGYDVVMVDECQDVSGVMLSILQSQKTAQKIYVGDKFQKIYSFTGSVDITGMVKATTCVLSKSFRFGQGIADVANVILSKLGNKTPLVGGGQESIMCDGMPDAILCRNNSEVVRQYIDTLLVYPNLKINISCDTHNILSFANGLIELREKGSTTHPILRGFKSFDGFYTWLKTTDDDVDPETSTLASLCAKVGVERIVRYLTGYTAHKFPQLTISTAHKSKGLEWNVVELASDFKIAEGTFTNPEIGFNDEELRLFYVACTRAKKCLRGHQKYFV